MPRRRIGASGRSLSGSAHRFSREDLFTAIVQPSRDVSPALSGDDDSDKMTAKSTPA